MIRRFLPLLLIAGACSGTEPEPVDVEALDRAGPHGVGFMSFDVTYDAPPMDAPRTTHTFVWYPAAPDAAGEHPIYTLKTSEVAVTDAAPKDLGGGLPVVMFSHGSQAYAAAMSHFMEHLASHGFLVVAPTHVGNTFADGADRTTDIYYLRMHDIRGAYDAMRALPADHPLAGLAGTDVAISGHSFGAYTSFALAGATHAVDELDAKCVAGTASPGYCSELDDAARGLFRAGFEDDRFSAVISVDPGDFDLFTRVGVANVDVPVLHMVAELSGEDRYWPALSDARDVRMMLKDGEHNDFVDACGAGLEIRCSDLRPERVFRPVRVMGLAFLRAVLLGETGLEPVLAGHLTISELVEISTH
jgi:predicted dienelactone hydrolase